MATVTDDQAKANVAANLSALFVAAKREDGTPISQAELARATDISPMAISFYLRGKREPGAGPLSRLAEFFGITIDELVSSAKKRKGKKTA